MVKCLLAKIYDERTRRRGDEYHFQVFHKAGRPETAREVFERVNKLYEQAYKRYVDPSSLETDEISTKEFSEERVKTVVQALQQLSITMGAVRNGDVIGTFFEEIIRCRIQTGPRECTSPMTTLARFMVEAVGLRTADREHLDFIRPS